MKLLGKEIAWSLDAEGAALAMTTIGLGFEIMSALNSSPWTAENFGSDPKRAQSCWKYTLQGVCINAAMGAGASYLTESWWPLLGTSAVSIYLGYTYWAALQRGLASGNTGWAGQDVQAQVSPLQTALRNGAGIGQIDGLLSSPALSKGIDAVGFLGLAA